MSPDLHVTTTRSGRAACTCGWRSARTFYAAERFAGWHRLAVGETIDNPYLREFLAPIHADEIAAAANSESYAVHRRRDRLTAAYAWAIPTEDVLRRLAALSPICDLGCGTGYWAKLLGDVGARVLAVDKQPPLGGGNPWHRTPAGTSGQSVTLRHFVPVVEGDARASDVPPDHALMLCWPPYHDDMASRALERYRGERVIYVGEGHEGCTGDDAFHAALDAQWDLVAEHEIPQWDGLHDGVHVYARRSV